MTTLKAKPTKEGVEIRLVLTDKAMPQFRYSEREIDLVTKAFTQGRCSKESLKDYLTRIGATK